jgi:hypothetical protein
MRATGLFCSLFAFALIAAPQTPAAAGFRSAGHPGPALHPINGHAGRPSLAMQPFNGRPGYKGHHGQRWGGASGYLDPSPPLYYGDAPQAAYPAPYWAPQPMYVEYSVAPRPVSNGPRLIIVDRRKTPAHHGKLPVVIYGAPRA